MEASPEESVEVAHGDLVYIVKGKRTKRQRQYLVPTMASSSSDERTSSSPATATTSDRELGDSTEEEEDLANCLILLAQSGGKAHVDAETVPANFDSKRGPDLYECKTCSKCFPSFQALGGHRASHKKPKAVQDREKMVGAVPTEDAGFGLATGREANMTNLVQQPEGGGGVTSPPAGVKGKVHECSICGSEFTSGQALGGHMRRHRIVSESPEPKKHKRSLFSLDLNLPAPDDSDTATEFAKFRPESNFTTKQPIMFAALVDCHN